MVLGRRAFFGQWGADQKDSGWHGSPHGLPVGYHPTWDPRVSQAPLPLGAAGQHAVAYYAVQYA